MAILTDLKAKAIKEGMLLPHGGVVGLVLVANKRKGHGRWVLRYTSPTTSKRRNIGLGSYPEIGIAEIGKTASGLRLLITKGVDPLDVNTPPIPKVEKIIPTFSEAAIQVHTTLLPSWKNKKHGDQWINTLKQYAFPIIGQMKLDNIQPNDIADVLKFIWLEKAETANRIKQRIYAVMSWGWAQGYCQSNPTDVVHHLLPIQESKSTRVEHQPAMPWRDIPSFVAEHFACIQQYSISKQILLFLILTAVRSGEVRGAEWKEIDFTNKVWTIPAERMKAKVIHRVPLSEQAIVILKSLRGLDDVIVFPSPRKKVILSDMVLTKLLRDIKAKSDTPNRIATAHGFRSSFRDWCSENGYPENLAERSLAHTIKNKVEAAYHRTDLLEQRRSLMQDWANFIMKDTVLNIQSVIHN